MSVDVPMWRIIDALFKALRLKAVYADLELCTELMRKAVCSFQLEYTNYQFVSSRAHRAFKQKFLECPSESHSEFRTLQEYLDAGLKKLCGDQAAAIHEYFRNSHRHRELPRVGIHGVTDEEEVVDIVIAPSAQKRIAVVSGRRAENYSSLSSVFTSGFPYLCNSVPSSCKKEAGYKNGDFDVEQVRTQYRKKMVDSKLLARWRNNFFRKTETDSAWNSLATSAVDKPQPYKSQLIIPITYRTHADFGRLDANLIDILGLLDDGRSILGLITVDHPAAYYFDDGPPQTFENIDINILYLFADMLSLIFVTQFMYTIGSESVSQYRERYADNVLS